jgi:hypothetical protein
MSSQESVGENQAPQTYEETDADLKRIDVTNIKEEELKMPGLPDTVKPPNTKFISYHNLKKSVASSLPDRMHPWVDGALTVTEKLRKEIMNRRRQVNKLKEENRILRSIIARNMSPPSPKEEA